MRFRKRGRVKTGPEASYKPSPLAVAPLDRPSRNHHWQNPDDGKAENPVDGKKGCIVLGNGATVGSYSETAHRMGEPFRSTRRCRRQGDTPELTYTVPVSPQRQICKVRRLGWTQNLHRQPVRTYRRNRGTTRAADVGLRVRAWWGSVRCSDSLAPSVEDRHPSRWQRKTAAYKLIFSMSEVVPQGGASGIVTTAPS